MIALDIVCLIICIIFLLQGIWYGFLKGLFFITAWVAAALGAYFSYSFLGDFFSSVLDFSQVTIRIICLAIGFLAPFLLFSILGRYLHKAITKTVLNLPNRFLGALLGLCKSIILCSLILTVVHIIPLTGSWEEARKNSVSYNAYLMELSLFGIDSSIPDIKGIVSEKASTAVDNAEKIAKEKAEKAIEKTIENALPAKKETSKSSKIEAKQEPKQK